MKLKKIAATSSALLLAATTALTGFPVTAQASQQTNQQISEALPENNPEESLSDEPQETETSDTAETPGENLPSTEDKAPAPLPDSENSGAEENTEEIPKPEEETENSAEGNTETEAEQKEPAEEAPLAEGIQINETTFPDSVLRDYVANRFDSNRDAVLSPEEIQKATTIFLTNSKTSVSSLEGLQYFTELTKLSIAYSNLTSINLSGFSKLEEIKIYNNSNLSSLSVSSPVARTIDCYKNALTSLTLNTPVLVALDCHSNQLAALDVSNMKYLTRVRYESNPPLKTLDFRGCTNLVYGYHSVKQETVYISAGMTQYRGCDAVQHHTGNLVIDLDGYYTVNPDGSKSVDLSKVISSTFLKLLASENHPSFNAETNILTIPATEKVTMLQAGKDDSWHPTTWTFYTDITAVDDCSVKFNSNGGTPVEDQIIPNGGTATEPAAPTMDGHIFSGWYLDEACTIPYDFTSPVTTDIILYAQWEKVEQPVLNTPPVITAKDMTLTVGDSFDPLKDVTASDKEDGTITLTKEHIIANDVDTSKAGTYHVTYKVTDKNGASTEKTITVTVKAAAKPAPKPESKPQQKPQTTNSPKTGDASSLGLLASMFAGSSGILAVLAGKKRRKR